MSERCFLNSPFEGRCSPFEELDLLSRKLDRLSEAFYGGSPFGAVAGVFPLTNVTERKYHYHVRAELHGVKSDDIDISVAGRTLAIAGERKASSEEGATYTLRGHKLRFSTSPSPSGRGTG